MPEWLASGRVLDLIVAGMVLEGLGLFAYHAATGRRVAPGRLLPNLISGAFLLLAMRAALGGAWWGWVSALLLAALLGHLYDLRRAWH